ncbi:hypothetical protein CORC01_04751 [Colletotrichum orchidophilum]|uniref:Uncharacterized protein n=1 Tax=Colletotrichum orchidophilum TaxID=1209926 RepID=A0A1G4BEQ7_9PEZI|nr:uncharacterized protein CORC01_04751 [Colletotrichum orchidophilum]OHE99850.1 hypothetical protein CORC01_04751 [Colletotrichum orchidophilum]
MASSSSVAPEAEMLPSSFQESAFPVGRTGLSASAGKILGRGPVRDLPSSVKGASEDEIETASDSEVPVEIDLTSSSKNTSPAESTPPTELTSSAGNSSPVSSTLSAKNTPPSTPPTKIKIKLKGTPPAQTQPSTKPSPGKLPLQISPQSSTGDDRPRTSSDEHVRALSTRVDMGQDLTYSTTVNFIGWQHRVEGQIKDLKDQANKTERKSKTRLDKLEGEQEKLEEVQDVRESRSSRIERRVATVEELLGIQRPRTPGLYPPGDPAYFGGPESPSRLPGAWGPRSSRSSRTGSQVPLPSIETSNVIKSIAPPTGGRSAILGPRDPAYLSPSKVSRKRKYADMESDDDGYEKRGAKQAKKAETQTIEKKPAKKAPAKKQRHEDKDDVEAKKAIKSAETTHKTMTTPQKPQKRKADEEPEEPEENGEEARKQNREEEDSQPRRRSIKKVKTAKKSSAAPKKPIATAEKHEVAAVKQSKITDTYHSSQHDTGNKDGIQEEQAGLKSETGAMATPIKSAPKPEPQPSTKPAPAGTRTGLRSQRK